MDTNCPQLFKAITTPCVLGDQVALTQTLDWVGARTSRSSTFALAAGGATDVVAASDVARKNNLRWTIERQYDSDGLFFVRHRVGSEEWSADGFTKLA